VRVPVPAIEPLASLSESPRFTREATTRPARSVSATATASRSSST
jgi:hypothetical protein